MEHKSLGLHEAASQLDVHYMTCYRYVRLGLLPATKDGRVWRVEAEDLATFIRERAGRTSEGAHPGARIGADWSSRYESRIMVGDQLGAWSIIENCQVSGTAPTEIYLDVIAPAMKRIGDRWASGQLTVAHEHRATTVVLHHLGRLSPRFRHRGQSRGTILLGCVPGERHDIGLSMMSDFFRIAGYVSISLGADVPLHAFESAASETANLVAVAIGVHDANRLDAAKGIIELLRSSTEGVYFIVGGQGIIGVEPAHLGADFLAEDASSAIRWTTTKLATATTTP